MFFYLRGLMVLGNICGVGKKAGLQADMYVAKTRELQENLKSWVLMATSPAEMEIRKKVAEIFGCILPNYWRQPKGSIKDPSGNYELVYTPGSGYACFITLQRKLLTSFPEELPRFNYKMELLDLSNNFLKEIPQQGYYTSINMSGNPLNECLDSIKVNVQYLDLRHCGIKNLTSNLISDLTRMACYYEKRDLDSDVHPGVLHEINLSGNPLSENSIALIENYAADGHITPDIIYDKGEESGLKSSTLANAVVKEVTPEISIDNLEKANKVNRYVPTVNLVLADYKKEIEARKEKIKGIEEKFRLSTEYFDVEITSNISNIIKNKVADFLNELKPLSDQDWKFKEYVKNVFDELFNDEIATEFLFKNLDSFDGITFNAINLSMLMSKVAKGKFDDRPELLVESLRDHFLSMKIKEEHSKSELDFVRWESFLQSELHMNIEKKCYISFVPPTAELIKMRGHLLSEEMKGSKEFIVKNAIWKEFVRRTLPEG